MTDSSFPPNLQITFNPKQKSLGAEILREGSPPPTCHMSRVMVHVSCVTCRVLHVMCQFLFFFISLQSVKLGGGGSVINGTYPAWFHSR